MGQRDVGRTLGRLMTDAAFQQCFFQDPARACLVRGVQLAPHELEALLRVPCRRLGNLSGKLDDWICRLHIEHSDDHRAPMTTAAVERRKRETRRDLRAQSTPADPTGVS
jgi:hypothetical protein